MSLCIKTKYPTIEFKNELLWDDLKEWKNKLDDLKVDTSSLVVFVDNDFFPKFNRALLDANISQIEGTFLVDQESVPKYIGINFFESGEVTMQLYVYNKINNKWLQLTK